jgi:hypothetical protein
MRGRNPPVLSGVAPRPDFLMQRTEIGRLPSSLLGDTRPVHMYVSPAIDERQYDGGDELHGFWDGHAVGLDVDMDFAYLS